MSDNRFQHRVNEALMAVDRAYLVDETKHLDSLLPLARLNAADHDRVESLARRLVEKVRESGMSKGGVEAFMHEYDLSSQEGVLLMCLAEALLRIPDAETADRLIKDKLSRAEWNTHLGQSSSLFVNASTWGLLLTGQVVQLTPELINDSPSLFRRLLGRSGEPVIRIAIKQAMRIIGHQFVMGQTIEEALDRSKEDGNGIYRHSFDMLGEAALTAKDAQNYFEAYHAAISTLAENSNQEGSLFENPGISVKLSALHPRYEFSQRERVLDELPARVLKLAQAAKAANINMTIDAEEAHRLTLSLEVFNEVVRDESLKGWPGLGIAIQAYQKRALKIVTWITELALECKRQIPIRLVKGAYWDSEIKSSQEQGLNGYPVFTRKASTDVAYLACARRVLDAGELLYPQFATHNAHTVAAIITMAGQRKYEFQRLHGMGETLFEAAILEHELTSHCRVYSPVGSYKDLLPYLVRRLLENGANTSFVNRIVDDSIAIEAIIADPVGEIEILKERPHPRIPLPRNIFGEERLNSSGINLAAYEKQADLLTILGEHAKQSWQSTPIINGDEGEGAPSTIINPANNNDVIGEAYSASVGCVEQALKVAYDAAPSWANTPATERARILEKAADLFEEQQTELMSLCIREGGRTIVDALSEVREATDFCRYYAAQAKREFDKPFEMVGVTGESNQLRLTGRGVFVCISPWNFPVAIFTGQITAALAAGNTVIAKPAALTPLAAAQIIQLLHSAGVPKEVLHFLPGSSSEIGKALTNDERIAGIAFTGSTTTARRINQDLAQGKNIIPLIAETGGQNAMIVDSSAQPEQVVQDIITSAFNSAGQRCSALRVLFLQQDVADSMLEMLCGAMDELSIGDPALFSTDIGPVIDPSAQALLQEHAKRMTNEATLIKALELPDECKNGSFFAPHIFQIDHINQLEKEVFGPILHVVKYKANKLDDVLDAINNTGYGLTLGIHSRIDSTVEYIRSKVRCGNTYVNRNMIGAVVGSQPFGGEGLSGSGPKAGGPYYLHRFATERVVTINTAAVGGNASLLSMGGDEGYNA
ncbi:bifunctional proline dehydrogenase/L-glutamate gamma-semialdehyde dehydrogenase PutA [Pseudomonadota bacterium]